MSEKARVAEPCSAGKHRSREALKGCPLSQALLRKIWRQPDGLALRHWRVIERPIGLDQAVDSLMQAFAVG